MNNLKKADSIFKWIILGLAIIHLVTYFMPVLESSYGSWNSSSLYYWYYGGSVVYTSLLIPIIALVFLFANFKYSRLFFIGLSATYFFNSIFNLLGIADAGDFVYGYYIYVVTFALFVASVVSGFIIYLIIKAKSSKTVAETPSQPFESSDVDVLRKRIELLDDLKNQGILTESEYEQKRKDIIKDLKI